MNEQIKEFLSLFQEVTNDAQRFCFAARAKEFQAEAIARLKDLRIEASRLKADMIAAQDEQSANLMLSTEERIDALMSELQMWVALKEDNPNAAWDALVGAQAAARTAIRAFDESSSGLSRYIERLHLLEELLFPPQTFMSVGMTIKRSSCSICGQEYGDCDHLAGKVYMGRMCAREIKEAELLEISIVSEPANKHARVTSFTENGVTRDLMSWRMTSEPLPDDNTLLDLNMQET